MAVTFTSNGYDTTTTNPYTESAWAEAHPVIGLAKYGVRSPLDWKVTAVSGQDRTVSIAAGRGFGHGVTDKTVANETIQLDTISSGSRWDLIACRRDWTPTAGVSQFVKVNGGATAVIPGGRLAAPGGIDDQPIALVQVTAGQTQPTSIIDLRTWSGDGGGVIANHDLVRSYMDGVGTRLHINGIDWIRRVGANDTPEWFTPPTIDVRSFTATEANWAYSVKATLTTDGTDKQVTVAITIVRTGGGNFTFGPNAWTPVFSDLVPSGWRTPNDYVATLTMTGPTFGQCAAYFTPGGGFQLRSFGPTYTIAPGLGITGTASWAVA